MMVNFKNVRDSARKLAQLSAEDRTQALEAMSSLLLKNSAALYEAGVADLREHGASLPPAGQARLQLDEQKLGQIVAGVRQVAALADPVGRIIERTVLDEELILEKIAIPLGVFAIIFESRADVAPQILSLAIRSGNGVILKGGSETRRINSLYAQIASEIPGLPPGWFQMHHDRDVVERMLKASGEIDLIIPRGSNEMVQSIMERSRVPVLGHADGVCHVYVHHSAPPELAIRIIIDAKTQYPAACNAVETVLVDRQIADSFLPLLSKACQHSGITIKGDEEMTRVIPSAERLSDKAWHTEYGDLIMAVRVVDDITDAVMHINQYGSHHTDAIVCEDPTARERFLAEVDSANVYSNCSTRFADGFRYGFGAEIGISTGRIHARGPVGVDGLMTYKYLLRGKGQIVASYSGPNARHFLHRKLPC